MGMRIRQSCRSCVHYKVPEGRRVMKNNVFPCAAPVPTLAEMKLPDSVAHAYGFRWPPSPSYMSPDSGASCPAYAKKEKV